jgi:hypothetical protein
MFHGKSGLMEAKYEARKQELLEECTVASQVVDRALPRLKRFMELFVEPLVRREQQEHAHTFVQGLLSDLEHKNVELSNANAETEVAEFARVAKAEHRVEECIQRAKSEAGLAAYEVRNWKGWHHRQTLSLIATWFLVCEARRGKKWTPAITVQQIREAISSIFARRCGCGMPSRILLEREKRLARNELARLYHWKQHKRLAPLNINKRQI